MTKSSDLEGLSCQTDHANAAFHSIEPAASGTPLTEPADLPADWASLDNYDVARWFADLQE
jgi:hypothetical protein